MHKDVFVYSKPSKWLHWIIGILVLFMLLFGFFMEDVPKGYQRQVYTVHKTVGLTVLALMVVRIIMMVYYGRPRLPNTVARWDKVGLRGIQYGLYGLLIAMPLSGWILSVASGRTPQFLGLLAVPLPGIPLSHVLSERADTLHQVFAWCLVGFISVHILSVIKHHWLDKDPVLKRMLLIRPRMRK